MKKTIKERVKNVSNKINAGIDKIIELSSDEPDYQRLVCDFCNKLLEVWVKTQ